MNTDKLNAIASGDITGEAATEILRASLVEVHAAEELTRQHRAAIGAAEIALIYGKSCRPSRCSTFIERVG